VLGRVKPGVTPQQAESEASAIIAGIEPKFLCTAKPLTSDSDSAKPWMALLFAVTALVLLVACANVANMTLARAATRIRESGIRAALGAGKLRLARQFILESAALAVIAGVASLLLAQGAMALLRHIQPTGLPRAAELRLDWGVFGFALLLALVVAVVIGALPALQAARMEILELLNMGGARAGEHGLVRRSRDVLIAIQVALSVILLVGAGIMMRSLLEVSAVDLGFDAHNVLIFKLKAPEQWPMDKTRNFYVRLREKIGAVAGVEDVSYTNSSPPLEAASSLDVIADGSRTTPNRPVLTLFRRISPGYFRALGIPIIQGEDITERQLEVSNRDVLVNEAFVQQHWPGEDPLGRMVYLGNRISEEQKARIIGVAKNVKEGNITNSDWPEIYFPYAGDSNETMIGVRTDGAPLKFATAIRKAVTATDPAIAIYDMRTMEQVVDKALASQTFLAGFLGLFAGIATILAMIGIYGVVSYTARRRTHEIGIRLALGATRWSILRLLGGHYLIVTAIGLVIGVAGSVLLTKLIQAFLYRMTPYDPWTLACVVALLLATAGIAAWLPARRAASMDPMLALKCE
jgi:predicted permease